jgi:hypothetical protein
MNSCCMKKASSLLLHAELVYAQWSVGWVCTHLLQQDADGRRTLSVGRWCVTGRERKLQRGPDPDVSRPWAVWFWSSEAPWLHAMQNARWPARPGGEYCTPRCVQYVSCCLFWVWRWLVAAPGGRCSADCSSARSLSSMHHTWHQAMQCNAMQEAGRGRMTAHCARFVWLEMLLLLGTTRAAPTDSVFLLFLRRLLARNRMGCVRW